jgi:peptidoglycan hydrolase-like protein with peptidoglycan-binding domain
MSLASCSPDASKESVMARIHSLIFCLFFISACVTVGDDNKAPMPEEQAQTFPTASEARSASDPSAESPDRESNEVTQRKYRAPSKEEIRSLQAQLKAAGFDPGAADGILGPKTRVALDRLQSGCANLEDLLEDSASGLSPLTSGTRTSKLDDEATDKFTTKEEIRLIQVRLKDAGFDPGPFDGTLGPKTQSALLRMQSGCAAVKNFPPHAEIQITESPSSPAPDSEKRIQPAITHTARTAEAAKSGAGQAALGADNAPSKEEVRGLQMRLRNAGFDPGPIDGVPGPKTKSALDQYRASHGAMNARKLLSGIRFDY